MDAVRSATFVDSARVTAYSEASLCRFGADRVRGAAPANPGADGLHSSRGLALAYLGRKAEAIREGERGATLLPISRDAYRGPSRQHTLVRIYLLVGEPEKALDRLEPLLTVPYYLSPRWLKIDPTCAPLRGNPQFERLVAVK